MAPFGEEKESAFGQLQIIHACNRQHSRELIMNGGTLIAYQKEKSFDNVVFQ